MKQNLKMFTVLALATLTVASGSFTGTPATAADNTSEASYIVQADTTGAAREIAQHAGGSVQRELAIINGVAATLTSAQVNALTASDPSVRVTRDEPVITLAARKIRSSSLETSVSLISEPRFFRLTE